MVISRLIYWFNNNERPEGFLMYFPTAIYILLRKYTLQENLRYVFGGIISAIPILPWTIWRVNYYGYLIPNINCLQNGHGFILSSQIRN